MVHSKLSPRHSYWPLARNASGMEELSCCLLVLITAYHTLNTLKLSKIFIRTMWENYLSPDFNRTWI